MKADTDNFSIETYFPNYWAEGAVALTMSSIVANMASPSIDVRANVLTSVAGPRPPFIKPLMNVHLYRWLKSWIKRPSDALLKASRHRLKPFDVAYMWLESPPHISAYHRERNVLVVREMINCTQQRRRDELTNAYLAFGRGSHGISDELIETERQHVLGADYVFCPNPFVKESVVKYGFPAERCILTSYGWSERRMNGTSVLPDKDDAFTVVFAGTVDVRKGAPVLLEAWDQAKVKGRLLLAGAISDEVAQKYGDILRRDNVRCLGYVRDVGAVYRSGSVFCFPTWEEGGPQVTFEAMSQGLAPVVTPMGTGGAFTADENIGIVVQPGDVNGFVEAFRRLEQDVEYRRTLQAAAKIRAQRFTWQVVGAQRRSELIRSRQQWLASLGQPSAVPLEAQA